MTNDPAPYPGEGRPLRFARAGRQTAIEPRCAILLLVSTLLAGLVTAPATATQPASPLTLAPPSIDFGDVAIGAATTPHIVTITNDGSSTINITGLVESGDCADYTTTGPTASMLDPGASTDISAAFIPTARGTPICDVSVEHDGGLPANLGLAGRGVAAELSVSTDTIPFSDTRVGASQAVPLEISNVGELDLTVATVSIPGANSEDYLLGGFTAGTVSSGATVATSVTFMPLAAGPQDATLVVSSDDPVQANADVQLTGNATQALISVPTSRDFGIVVVDDHKDANVTIASVGTAPVQVTSLDISGSTADYSIQLASVTPFPIAAGAGDDVLLRCSPTSIGVKSASLEVTSDADNQSVASTALSCTGVKPDLEIDTTDGLSFAPTAVFSTSPSQTRTIAAANGAFASTLTVAITVEGSAAASFDATPTDFALLPGETQQLEVTFTPDAEGRHSAQLMISSDDQETPVVGLDLTGIGGFPIFLDGFESGDTAKWSASQG